MIENGNLPKGTQGGGWGQGKNKNTGGKRRLSKGKSLHLWAGFDFPGRLASRKTKTKKKRKKKSAARGGRGKKTGEKNGHRLFMKRYLFRN